MIRRPGIRPLTRLVAGRRRVESAVDDELQHHLDVAAEYWESRGMRPADAREEASRRFGSDAAYRAECIAIGHAGQRRLTTMDFIHSIGQDMRFAIRGLKRHPGFATSVVLTLALGIGATTAIFTVVDATMLRPVALPAPHELVDLSLRINEEITVPSFSIAEMRVVREAVPARLAASTNRSGSRTDLSPPDYVTVSAVEPAMFDVLGISPLLGRRFGPADATGEQGAVIVLSRAYWRSAFGADRDVVGRSLRLDDVSFTIIGVLGDDANFGWSSRSIGWIPLRDDGVIAGTQWTSSRVNVIGRLATGQSLESGRALAEARAAELIRAGTLTGATGIRVSAASFSRQNADVRRALWILMGAVGCLWLIAIVNGTNLFLLRNSARDAELGMRLALGASRRRIVRQVMSEAFVLALLSGIVAASVAGAGIAALRDLLPSEVIAFSRHEIEVTGRVYAFVFLVSTLSGFLFGVAPALRAVLRGGRALSAMHGRSTSRDGLALRNGLVIGEIALTVALLVGAGLLARSFARLNSIDSGFDATGVFTMTLSLPQDRYPTPERRAQFRDAILARLRGTPGVVAATEGHSLPTQSSFSFGVDSMQVDDGRWITIRAANGQTWLAGSTADEQYFDALRIPLRAGRVFTESDRGRGDVVIIDAELARTLFPTGAAVGRQIRWSSDGDWRTVVGVVGDALLLSPVGSPDAFHISERQVAYERYLPPSAGAQAYLAIAVRMQPGGPDARVLRAIVADIDPLLAVASLESLERAYADTIAKPRFNTFLMVVLGGVALLLTLVGVYGVLSFAVAQRTRELGIRMALGAQRGTVRWSVVAQALGLAVIGVAIGLLVAVWGSGTLRTLLFQVSTADAGTYVSVALLLLVTAAVAAWVPAVRATRVDPVTALRSE
jgi:predicted permease